MSMPFLGRHRGFLRQHAVETSFEFAGTMLLTVIGLGATLQAVALGAPTAAIPWAWAIGLAFAIVVAAPASGGHVNPAITLALAVWQGFPWRKVPGYLAAQLAGAAAGALVVRLIGDEVMAGGPAMFATSPVKVTDRTALLIGIVGTAALMFGVGAVLRPGESAPPRRLHPVLIGVLAGVLGVAFGPNTALNPATDVGPRLVAFWTGHPAAFLAPDGHPFWWVPIVGPLLGGVLGAALFAALLALTRRLAVPGPADAPTGPERALPPRGATGPVPVAAGPFTGPPPTPAGPVPARGVTGLIPAPPVAHGATGPTPVAAGSRRPFAGPGPVRGATTGDERPHTGPGPSPVAYGDERPNTGPIPARGATGPVPAPPRGATGAGVPDPWLVPPTWGGPPPGWTVRPPVPSQRAPEPAGPDLERVGRA